MSRSSLTQYFAWIALIVLPGLAFLVLRLTSLDFHSESPEGHFYIVSLSSILAAGFGLTSADWGTNGFGPWLSSVWRGQRLRTGNADKTGPIPGLLKG